jgi:hypothetical protein
MTFAEYVDVYSPLLYTPNPPSQVVRVATTAQEKMKPWRKTSKGSKIMTSFRRGLEATPQSAACEGRVYLRFVFALWWLLKTMWMSQTYDVIDYYYPFYVIIWALCDDVQLCNCCVRELLILARTWFAFGLPSKTGCDTYWVPSKLNLCIE